MDRLGTGEIQRKKEALGVSECFTKEIGVV